MPKYDWEMLKAQIRPFEASPCLYRLTGVEYADTPLGVAPSPSRFSDPESKYSVLYLAESPGCCLWEARLRGHFVTRTHKRIDWSELDSFLLVVVEPQRTLNVVDLTGNALMKIGASRNTVHGSGHTSGQAFSSYVYHHLPQVDGILYRSTHTEEQCVALYDRAINHVVATRCVKYTRYAKLHALLQEYGIGVTGLP